MPDYQSLSDEELARQSQDGSLVAFEELVARYERRIYAFVFQSCRSDVDARELTQDTFVRAFQALRQFDGRHAFAPWLFTIARRKCVDAFRARRVAIEADGSDEPDTNDPAALLERREESENLWMMARRTLPEGHYQALWLYYVEEMTVAQVAAALGKTQTHAKVMLLRARRALGKAMAEPAAQQASPLPKTESFVL